MSSTRAMLPLLASLPVTGSGSQAPGTQVALAGAMGMTTRFGDRFGWFLGGASLLGVLMCAAACSSSSSGGKTTEGDAATSDAAPGDATAEDAAPGDATAIDAGTGDAGGDAGTCMTLCASSQDPAAALAANGTCLLDGSVSTCGEFFDIASHGLDTTLDCYYDKVSGAFVASNSWVSGATYVCGPVPDCGTWEPVACRPADAGPLTDGAPTD
jgi:hypothetical protein